MKLFFRLSDGINRVVVAGGTFANIHPGRIYNANTDSWADLPLLANKITWASAWVLNRNTFYLTGQGPDSTKVFYMRFTLSNESKEVEFDEEWGVLPEMDATLVQHVRMISL